MIQHGYVEQLERDLEAMKKDRDGLKAALLGQVKQQSDSMRNWAKELAALKIRVGVLERENAALKEAFAKAELLSDPAVAEGHYEYVEVWGYFRPNEIAVVIDRAAFNAARKEDKS